MEALSDGVFAVALTLLVVDIATTGLPKLGSDWWHDFWPKAVSFIYSFLVVGMYWIIHHNEMDLIKGTSRELLWLNLVFLLFIVFIPFSAALLGANWRLANDDFWYERIPILTYSANLILAGAALQATWLYASHRAYLLGERAVGSAVDDTTKRNLLIPIATLLVAFIALIWVEAGQWLIVAVPLSYVLWTLWAARQIRLARARPENLSLKRG
jgi:uncharacterized membrane protein